MAVERDPHYLERELHELIATDPSIFAFIEAGLLDGLWFWDLENAEHEWLSPRFWTTLGYDPAQRRHLASEWQELIVPEDLEVAKANLEKHLADPAHPYDQVVRYRHREGHLVWVRCKGVAIRDSQGRPRRMLGAHTDLTALKQAESELRRQRDLMTAILDATTDALFVKDAEGRYLIINSAGAKMVGQPPEAITGRDDTFIFGPEDATNIQRMDRSIMLGGRPVTLEEPVSLPHGPTVFLSVKAPWLDADGHIQGLIGIARDITERKRAESELARSNAELEQYASVISHDLREPLRTITAFGTLLETLDLGASCVEAAEYVTYMTEAARRLSAMVSELLDLSRIGAGDSPYEEIDLRAVLEGALADLRGPIEDCGACIEHGTLPRVRGNATELARVFRNLIGNALKFRGERAPRIVVTSLCETGTWTISVSDRGIGFDPVQEGRIFEMFRRLHGRGKYPGTGAGLAICKKIVERHGGRIWATSIPGQGSTFFFSLPALA